MRGAIVEGEFFHNDIIVYGKGLVEAVQLEENIAKYPRILVKTKVNEANSCYYLVKDSDDKMFLNIFHLCEGLDNVIFRVNILGLLKKYKNNEKIREKIMWMINYFNSWFTKYEYRIMNQQKIAEEEIQEAIC